MHFIFILSIFIYFFVDFFFDSFTVTKQFQSTDAECTKSLMNFFWNSKDLENNDVFDTVYAVLSYACGRGELAKEKIVDENVQLLCGRGEFCGRRRRPTAAVSVWCCSRQEMKRLEKSCPFG